MMNGKNRKSSRQKRTAEKGKITPRPTMGERDLRELFLMFAIEGRKKKKKKLSEQGDSASAASLGCVPCGRADFARSQRAPVGPSFLLVPRNAT